MKRLTVIILICALVSPSLAGNCGVRDDIAVICLLVGVENPDTIPTPMIIWVDDEDICKKLYCIYSNTLEVGYVLAIYLPRINVIIFNRHIFNRRIYIHELTHVVTNHAPHMKDKPIDFHEQVARQVEMLLGK